MIFTCSWFSRVRDFHYSWSMFFFCSPGCFSTAPRVRKKRKWFRFFGNHVRGWSQTRWLWNTCIIGKVGSERQSWSKSVPVWSCSPMWSKLQVPRMIGSILMQTRSTPMRNELANAGGRDTPNLHSTLQHEGGLNDLIRLFARIDESLQKKRDLGKMP